MKGREFMIILIVGAYGALVLMAFWVANSENSKASAAEAKAQIVLKHAEALDAGLQKANEEIKALRAELEASDRRTDEAYKGLVDTLLKNDLHGEKLKHKLEWLEMKVSNMPKTSPSPSEIKLTQDKPLQFTVITRQGPPAKLKKPEPAKTQSAPKEVIESVKKKMKELSQ